MDRQHARVHRAPEADVVEHVAARSSRAATGEPMGRDVGDALLHAVGIANAATSRVRRATHDLASSAQASRGATARASSGSGALVIRRRVGQDWATWSAQAAAANAANAAAPARTPLQLHAGYLKYVTDELTAIEQAFAGLPPAVVQGVTLWSKTALSELLKLRPDKRGGQAPTAQELQTWRTDYLDVLVEMVNDLDDQGQAIAARAAVPAPAAVPAAANAGTGGDWTDQPGRFARANPNAIADFHTLVAALDPGSIYTREMGSIVGGYEGKPVEGLNDTSARIDAQVPVPVVGLFNVQYQVNGASYGGILFSRDDDEATILEQFEASVTAATAKVSPAYTQQRAAPKAKETLSKKQKEERARANKSKK